MNTSKSISTAKSEFDNLNDLIIDAIQDIKGQNIVKLDLRKIEDAPSDYFIVCEGESTTQVRAIADHISKRAKSELFLRPNHKEGLDSSKWILVDFFDTIIHVFHKETREYYEIEDLWSDAETTEYETL